MKIIMRIILFILGVLSAANAVFLSSFSNFSVGFAAQWIISALLILYAILFNKIPKKAHIAVVVLCSIPMIFTAFLFTYGNTTNVSYDEDVVIILGAGVIGETVTRPLAHRLNRAFEYWHKNPDAYFVVCGGLGNRARITEAEAMARYLNRRGIPMERILLEDSSTNTFENLTFAKEILDEKFPNGYNSVVITNDFHLYRAVRTARGIGIYATRLGAYTDWYTMPVNYLREMMAVMYSWVSS